MSEQDEGRSESVDAEHDAVQDPSQLGLDMDFVLGSGVPEILGEERIGLTQEVVRKMEMPPDFDLESEDD